MFRKKGLKVAKRIAAITYIVQNEKNINPDSFVVIIKHLVDVALLCGGEKMLNTVQSCLEELRGMCRVTDAWIDVNVRMPEKNDYVIVASDSGHVFSCLYTYDGWDLWEGNKVNITHWQPFPASPKGEIHNA